jgi:hypothetical protein
MLKVLRIFWDGK